LRRTYLPENYHVIQEMHLLNEEDQRKLRRRERAKRMRRKLTSLVKRRRVTCTLPDLWPLSLSCGSVSL
jgi:hypothetical protein